MRFWITGILILLMMAAPMDGNCQQRKRTRNKAKTTTVSKKNPQQNRSPKTSAEAKKKQAETQKEIQLTEAQIKENEAKMSKSLTELGKIDGEIESTNSKIKTINGEIQRLNREVSSLETNIKKNETDLSRLRSEYLKAVKKLRITKKNKSDLAFIFSSSSMNQAMRRMRYLREFSKWRSRQSDEIQGKINSLTSQKEELAKTREERTVALSLQKKNEELLSKQHKQQETLIAELKQNGKALEAHLKKKQTEAKELGSLVSQLIAEEQRKAEEEARKKAELEAKQKAEEEARLLALQKEKSEEKKTSDKSADKDAKGVYADARKRNPRSAAKKTQDNKTTEKSTVPGDSFESMKGNLGYPTSGSFIVTSKFGRQNLPDLPDVEYDNPGIDAQSDAGASARAVFKGKVSGVYLLPGYNTVVIVNHGNYYTVYGNIATPAVKTGDDVTQGTSLGALAISDDDASHTKIHFEVWKNREKLNPQAWLR